MSDTTQRSTAVPGPGDASTSSGLSGWGWGIVFGGAMTILVGVFQVMEGIVALVDEGYFRVRPNGLVVDVSYSVWGWVHVLLGVCAIVLGAGVLAGNAVARLIGVVVAFFSGFAHLVFLPAAPVWCLLVIGFDVVAIYALTVYGGELRFRHQRG